MVATFNDAFEVTWGDPADAGLTWVYDPMHFPRPMLPAAGDFLERMYRKYMNARTALVNGYAYSTPPTPNPPSPEIVERGVVSVWRDDYLPQIQEFCKRVRSVDYAGMDLEPLGAAVRDAIMEAVDAFGYTMLVISGFMGPTFAFVAFLQEELGEEAPQIAAGLLQGYENGTQSAGAGLSALAEEAAKFPAVAEALRAGRYEGIEALEGGPAFMAKLRGYLEQFGWRLNSWSDIQNPTWAEDPYMPLMLIGRYLADPDHSAMKSIERSVAQRKEAEREVEARFSGEKLQTFRAMLQECRAHVQMSEDRALNQLTIVGSLRVPILALGRKLAAAGALAAPEDVFYLDAEEMKQAAVQPAGATRAMVDGRKADYARWAKLTPVPFLGAPLEMSAAPPEMQALIKLFFGAGPPMLEGRQIKGQAASKGVASGRARVINDLSEADQLQAGEVMVCTTTAPPWTPLFAIASAVVTDAGGVLSHSAICAREFAIPCVVATQLATKVIKTGMMVTVDGGAGLVTIDG